MPRAGEQSRKGPPRPRWPRGRPRHKESGSMKRWVCVAVVAAAVAAAGRLAAGDKPKSDIAVIMEKAHKGGPTSLRARVLAGKASKEELDMLVELYEALGKGTPPRGTREAWKKKTGAVV